MEDANFLVGEVILVATTRSIYGFLPCDGRTLSSSQFGYLFAVIGTSYGGTNDQFALPNIAPPLAGTTYMIRTLPGVYGLNASFPAAAGLIGDIRYLAGPSKQLQGCIPALGFTVAINQFQALFSVIGNQFGSSDGSSFSIPKVPSLPASNGPGPSAYLLATGYYPSREGIFGENMVAEIRPVTSPYLQGGWLVCDGAEYPVVDPNGFDREALFSVIGTTFGEGSGPLSARVPNLPAIGGVRQLIVESGLYPRFNS